MEYTAHQKNLIRGMVARYDKWMAMDEMWTQLSTDAERTHTVMHYDIERDGPAEIEQEDVPFEPESEQDQLQEAEALNNI